MTELVTLLAEELLAQQVGHPVRVGIDGVCGSGKSTLARALVAAVEARGRPAVHLDSDGFHNVRAVRYRDGRASARGYYDNAYDCDALRTRVLEPLGPGGSREFATAVHDLHTDEVVTDATAVAADDAIVVFDCTFLQRGALRALWEEVIYLQVDREVAMARGIARDAAALGGPDAAREAYESRYLAACDIYVAEERPADRADVVVAYDDPANPRVLRRP